LPAKILPLKTNKVVDAFIKTAVGKPVAKTLGVWAWSSENSLKKKKSPPSIL